MKNELKKKKTPKNHQKCPPSHSKNPRVSPNGLSKKSKSDSSRAFNSISCVLVKLVAASRHLLSHYLTFALHSLTLTTPAIKILNSPRSQPLIKTRPYQLISHSRRA